MDKIEEINKQKDLTNSLPYIFHSTIFEIISIRGNHLSVKCNHCKTGKIVKGSIRSTGNFLSHLRRRHPVLFEKLKQLKTKDKQSTIDAIAINLNALVTDETNDLDDRLLKKKSQNQRNNIKFEHDELSLDEFPANSRSVNKRYANQIDDTQNSAVLNIVISNDDKLTNSNHDSGNSVDDDTNLIKLIELPKENEESFDHKNASYVGYNKRKSNKSPKCQQLSIEESNEFSKESIINDVSTEQESSSLLQSKLPAADIIFGQYVTQELSNLSEELKIRTKFKINTILYEAQLDNLTKK